MARSLSAKKRARQSLKRYARNKPIRSQVKTTAKKIRSAAAELLKQKTGQTKPTAEQATALKTAFGQTCSVLDKAVAQGVIHHNKAARLKSRLNRLVNQVS